MLKQNLSHYSKIIWLSLIFSFLSFGIAIYHASSEYSKNEKHFRVVDIKQLSDALMSQLEVTIKEQGVQLKPELIEVIAQNEAKKLFIAIANAGGENDIIIPKTSVIHAPEKYEITAQIAEKMGLKGIVQKNLKEMIAETSPEGVK